MKRILAFVGIVGIFAATVVAYGYLTSDRFGQRVIAILENEASKQGISLSVGAMRLSGVAPHLVIHNVSLKKDNSLGVDIASVEIEVDPFQLFSGSLKLSRLNVDSVTLDVHMPEPPQQDNAAKPDAVWPGMDIDFGHLPFGLACQDGNIKNVAVNLFAGKGTKVLHLSGAKLNLEMQGRGYYRVKTDIRSGWWTIPDTELHETLDGASFALLLQRRGLSLEKLKIKALGGSIALNGKIADLRSPEMSLASQVSAPLSSIKKLVPGFPVTRGTASANIIASGTITDPAIEGKVIIKDAEFEIDSDEIYKVDFAALPFTFADMDVHIKSGVVHTGPEGKIFIYKADLSLGDEKLPVSASIDFEEMELAELLDDLTVPGAFTTLKINGSATLAGTGKPFELKGKADLKTHDFNLYNQSFRTANARDDLIMRVPTARVKTDITINDKRVRLTNGTVSRNGTVVDVIRNDFNYMETIYLEYASRHIDMKDVGKIIGLGFGGSGTLHCAITLYPNPLSTEKPLIIGNLDMKDFSLEGFSLGTVKADVKFKDYILRFNNIIAKLKKSRLQTNLAFDFRKKEPRMSADWFSEGFALSSMFKLAGIDPLPPVTGKLFGAGDMHGPLDALRGSVDAHVTDVDVAGFKIPVVHAKVVISPGWNIAFNKLDAIFKEGRVSITGTLSEKQELDFTLVSHDLLAQHIPWVISSLPDLSGPVLLDAKFKGTTDKPFAKGNCILPDPVLGTTPVGETRFTFGLKDGRIGIDGHIMGNQAIAQMEIDTGKGNFTLTGSSESFDFAKIVQAVGPSEVGSGTVAFNTSLKGTLARPKQVNGYIDISKFGLSVGRLKFGIDKTARIKFTRGVMELRKQKIVGPKGVALSVSGRVSPNMAAELVISGEAPLEIVPELTGAKWQSDGTLSLKMSITGNPKGGFLVDGRSTIRDASFLISKNMPRLENVGATLLFSGNKILIERLSGTMGGGLAKGSGVLELADDLLPKSVSINLSLNKVKYPISADIKPVLSGDIVFEGGREPPYSFKGDLKIVELRYVNKIPWEMRLFENISKIFAPRKQSAIRLDTKPSFTFDIGFFGRDTVQLDNNMGQVDFTADMRLVGSDVATGLKGTLSASKGFLLFQRKNLNVDSFIVRFTDESRIYSAFDVSMTSESIDYTCGDKEGSTTISIRIKGTEDDYQLEYTASSPDLIDKTQIWSVLLANNCGMQQQDFENEMKNLVGGIVTTPLEQSLGVETSIVFEPVQTSATTTKVVPRFTVGKSLTPNMTIIYSSTFAEEEGDDRRVKLKYRKKNLTVYGEWSSGNRLQQGGFGIDVMYHIDIE